MSVTLEPGKSVTGRMKQLATRIVVSSVFVLSFLCSNGQVSTGYTFSSANSTINFISGGNLLASGGGIGSPTDDAIFPNQSIGFNFRFNGAFYSTVGVSSNGFIWFGNTSPAATLYTPISSNTGYDGVIAVFAQNITGQDASSEIRIQTQGVAPNKTCTIQWEKFVGNSIFNASNNRMDLWIILSECSNTIQTAIAANKYYWAPADVLNGQVGIRGGNNGDYFNRQVNCNGGNTWLQSTQGPSNGTLCVQNPCWPGGGPFSAKNAAEFNYTPTSSSVPSITCSANTPVCTGQAETINVNGSGGYTPYTIDWSVTGGGAAPASGNASNINSLPYNGISTTFSAAASANYNVTLTDNSGCMATCNGPITVNACVANTITTGTVAGSPFCPCGSVSIPFTSTGTFNAGNTYTAELSDSTGSFAAPLSLGSFSGIGNSGTISGTIPCNILPGSRYRIRVTSSNPTTTGTDNGVDLVIASSVPPSVFIVGSAINICSGNGVHFTAVPTNGGSAPHYQWFLNNQPVGTDSAGYTVVLTTSSTSADTDLVKCVMTTSTTCIPNAVDTSNEVLITVNSTQPAAVSIAASPGTTICPGTPVTFTPTPTNPGPLPGYKWFVNGQQVATSTTYTDNNLANGDSIYCIMNSSNFCANPASGTSNKLVITVTQAQTPSVTITASDSLVCTGTAVTFHSSVLNAGNNVSYDWQVDSISSGTDSVFIIPSISDSITVTCTITSSLSCLTTPTATSNAIKIHVVTAPVLSINPPQLQMCTGTPIQVNVSGADSYVWSPNIGLSCVSCSNPFIDAPQTMVYKVTGYINSCLSVDSMVVAVVCPGNFVPSAFSPNGDGINDVLKVAGPPINGFNMKIFNRWGELVFESNNQDFGWDGTFKLQDAAPGVYVWMLSGTGKTGEKVLIQGKNCGNVALLR